MNIFKKFFLFFISLGFVPAGASCIDDVHSFVADISKIASKHVDTRYTDGNRSIFTKHENGSVIIEVQAGSLAVVLYARMAYNGFEIEKIDYFDKGQWRETLATVMNGCLYIRGLHNLPLYLHSARMIVDVIRCIVLRSQQNIYNLVRYDNESQAVLENTY